MRLIYQLSLAGYETLLRLAAPFNAKARLWIAGRKNWRTQLQDYFSSANNRSRRVAWFHAASLGEFEQGRTVMEAFRKQYPDYLIVLTFFSPSGYEIRKNYDGADYIAYLPTDTAANARDFLALVKPEIAFFIKYEFWYHYLTELRNRNAIIISFSAVFRSNQVFFKSYGGFYRQLLHRFDAILVQNDASVELLSGIGLGAVVRKGGDTRFDRVEQLPQHARLLPEIAAFTGNAPCLVVGSVWNADMELLIPVLNHFGEKLKVIIAPHEIDTTLIERWTNQLRGRSLRYSDYREQGFRLPSPAPSYLIIDNIGMLSSLYRYGTFAYIGGAFGVGLHNILEAATYGLPVFFGNRSYQRFQEAIDLIRLGGACAIGDEAALRQGFSLLLEEPAFREAQSAICSKYVREHTGATAAVMQTAKKLLLRH